MKETLKHQEVFNLYYGMGKDRSLAKLREKMSSESPYKAFNLKTLQRWSKEFNWQERIIQRDIQVAKGLEKQMLASIVSTKAKYRKEIADSLSVIRAALLMVAKKLKERVIEPEEIGDLQWLTTAQDRLVKLDLLLLGEATAKVEQEVSWKDIMRGD